MKFNRYFSAYATWKPEQMMRHRAYVAALEAAGVTIHMARFSTKDRACPSCKHHWKGHEEKETDVKIAVNLLSDAVKDNFDHALIVSRDSDLVPAARALKDLFPEKTLCIVAPPHSGHSSEMLLYADSKRKIKLPHLDRHLLPYEIEGLDGSIIECPEHYQPPTDGS